MSTPVDLVPLDQDPLQFAAARILEQHPPPDLDNCTLLVSEPRCAPALRSALLDRAAGLGFDALLGGRITTLPDWLNEQTETGQAVLNRPASELMLAAALRQSSDLYVNTDPWLLAQQLLGLFEEMAQRGLSLPADGQAFASQLLEAYDLPEPNPAFQREAWMLHTLWQAWQTQLETEGMVDQATAYNRQLACSLAANSKQTLWLIGFCEFTPAELAWIRRLDDQGRIRLILHGGARHTGLHPDAPLHLLLQDLDCSLPVKQHTPAESVPAFIDALFAPPAENLERRARSFAAAFPDPLTGRVLSHAASDAEQEAQAVALQVRRWLIEGSTSIAIITEDRLLARRVRALLESSGITMQDTGGWALSTTSAAAVLERWLECVEEDFACGPLLDVLKSPFVVFGEREQHLGEVYRFEQDIVLHERIARNLMRYRQHLDSRSARLPHWSETSRQSIHLLLNHVEHAATPLLELLDGAHRASDCLQALLSSITELGLAQALSHDEAGQRVLSALQELQQAASLFDVTMSWLEMRNWLGRHLETSVFSAATTPTAVRLLTFEQSRLQRFDAAVIAGCNSDKLPGTPLHSAFFNQRVRAELGLGTWTDSLSVKLHHFCRNLFCADRVLLTWHNERDGEPVVPGPWIELLHIFHRKAYGSELRDHTLETLLHSADSYPASNDTAALPGRSRRPAPVVQPALHPGVWSASSHQRIIECPYRYFAADILRLKPGEDISEALSYSDYGTLVHHILQAFHRDLDGLPGPWGKPLVAAQRQAALAMLEDISRAVFNQAVRENFQARGWLQQWLSVAGHYIDWEIERQEHWQLRCVEFKGSAQISAELSIEGRIDRVDQHNGQAAILDYKTGSHPRKAEVLSGEAVQLSSYALLLDSPVARMEYLKLDDEMKPATIAGEDGIEQLLAGTRERLEAMNEAIQTAAPLPAQGIDTACKYCDYQGLCRKAMWSGESSDE